MRISDDRYNRDRSRLDLALRFIRHEARTHTIKVWTGLTDDRIRKLYRTYIADASDCHVPRHRGKSPSQAAFFMRSPRLRQETGLLASMLLLFDVVPPETLSAQPPRTSPSVPRGSLLCEAFEAYRRLTPRPNITFEHAVFLCAVLLRGAELRINACRDCGGIVVVDRLTLRTPTCTECQQTHAVHARPPACRQR
ncbi:MAG: hypothetical protein R3E72_10885 [Steroidobacteraceae bacterium]